LPSTRRYAFCSVVVIATLVFFLFFGKLCHDYRNGKETANICLKFQTEIMATGLVLFGLCAIVLVSSYLRGRMKFEVFYSLHIVAVGAIYAGAMIHTLDDEFRKGSKVGANRSQSFRWITGSLAVFLADRTWRYLTQESEVPVLRSHCHSDGGSVTLQVLKPWWFSFLPGQYLHLQVPAINRMWHPFSIASAPESNFLTLLIQVSPKEGQWTSEVAAMVRAGTLLRVNLRGPFGSSVGPQTNSPAAANIIAVGSGTGIVPMISLLKERADQLGLLSEAGLARTQSTLAQRQLQANQAYCLGQNVTHRTNEGFRHFQLKYRAARLAAFEAGKGAMPVFLKKATSSAGSFTCVVYAILTMMWICMEGATASLVLSWSNLDQRAYMAPGMVAALEALTVALIVPYMVVVVSWICCRSRAEHEASLYLHALAVITMIGVTASFIAADKFEALTPIEQTVLVVFSAWRLGAAWSYRCTTSRNAHGYASSNPVESFRMLWATRSAELVIGVLADLEKTFKDLEASMNTGSTEIVGTEGFPQLEIHVYCTDSNPRHIAALKTWLRGTRFENLVTFARAELGTELVTSMRRHIMAPSFMNRLPGEKKTCAVTFCGSPFVSDALFRAVRRCGQLAAVAGAADFEFTFRTENYSNMPAVRTNAAQEAASPLSICPVKPAPRRRLSQRDKEEIKANEWNTMRHSLVEDKSPTEKVGERCPAKNTTC
jgi:ferredoxin-NADP reductase